MCEGYARLGLFEEASSYLSELLGNRELITRGESSPSVRYLRNIVGYASDYGKLDVAAHYYKTLKEEGLLSANVMTLNQLILGCAHANRLGDALKYFEEMRLMALAPDAFTLQYLVLAYCRVGKRQEAMQLLAEMKLLGGNPRLRPTAATYHTLISAHADPANPQMAAALDVMQQLHAELGPAPTEVLNRLILCYAVLGDGEAAVRIWQELIVAKKRNPDAATFAALLLAMIRCGELFSAG
jgi:pentatricopeptide repeat protein